MIFVVVDGVVAVADKDTRFVGQFVVVGKAGGLLCFGCFAKFCADVCILLGCVVCPLGGVSEKFATKFELGVDWVGFVSCWFAWGCVVCSAADGEFSKVVLRVVGLVASCVLFC